jgi:hypothetical protein
MKTQEEINEKIKQYEKEAEDLWRKINDYNYSESTYPLCIVTMQSAERFTSYVELLKWILE